MGSQELCLSHFGAKIPILGLDLGKTSYNDLVVTRGVILNLVGAQNQPLSIILIYYIKIHILDLNNFARFTSRQKKPI